MKLIYPLLLISFSSYADIYKCSSGAGEILFKDTPCATSSEIYTPSPVMTSLKTIQTPRSLSNPPKPKQIKQSCPHFTSTELRNLKVKDQFKKGLSTDYVKKRLGKPDSTESSRSNEKWRYRSDNVWREFKFKHSCLVSWKVNWRKGESKLSKYQD